jgi:hypothetical protein
MSGLAEYQHVIYGLGAALVRNPDGSVREATVDELEKLQRSYASVLERSFAFKVPRE